MPRKHERSRSVTADRSSPEAVHARRERLFGRAVASLNTAEVRRWLRTFTNGHPNPGGEVAVEARRWLTEIERGLKSGEPQEPASSGGDRPK